MLPPPTGDERPLACPGKSPRRVPCLAPPSCGNHAKPAPPLRPRGACSAPSRPPAATRQPAAASSMGSPLRRRRPALPPPRRASGGRSLPPADGPRRPNDPGGRAAQELGGSAKLRYVDADCASSPPPTGSGDRARAGRTPANAGPARTGQARPHAAAGAQEGPRATPRRRTAPPARPSPTAPHRDRPAPEPRAQRRRRRTWYRHPGPRPRARGRRAEARIPPTQYAVPADLRYGRVERRRAGPRTHAARWPARSVPTRRLRSRDDGQLRAAELLRPRLREEDTGEV